MSEKDAVRPTGETGARTMTGLKRGLLEMARQAIANQLPEDEPDTVPDWVCNLLIGIGLDASRPLPDFPAGAVKEWTRDDLEIPGAEYIEELRVASEQATDKPMDCPTFHAAFLCGRAYERKHAPARPAAAGVALSDAGELSQMELDRVVSAAAIPAPSYAPDRIVYVDDVRRAITEYRKILSSRATGAEVELDEPDFDECCKGCQEIFMEGETAPTMQMCIKWYKGWLALRHATIRPGGGE